MTKLKKTLRSFHRLGYKPLVKMAPIGAVTFDRMIAVFFNGSILKVLFYNREKDEVVGQM